MVWRRFWGGLYFGFATNLACAATLNNNPWGAKPDAADWLVTFAAANELLGVA